MSLINLAEDFLYQRLPQGLIELDERFLIQAVVGGCQDRLEDLRSYGKKFELFFSTAVLPETGPNVVFVDLETSGGKAFTRSLDITASTPGDPTQLAAWAAGELGLNEAAISNARMGVDPLRTVDTSLLDYLATNIGAVLYKSAVAAGQPSVITQTGTLTAQQLAHQRLIETYFPRLKFKGTSRSFEALGRLLGFDDIRMVPLWGRVSPRLPSDPGSAVNDPDFAQSPEYWPQQETGPFYDPLNQADGPFFEWFGTVSSGTAMTNFYTQRVNAFQPWVRVDVLHGYSGTVTHPESGTYVLAGGAPHQKAFTAAGTDLRFTALGEGDSWNGISVRVSAWDQGTLRRLDISDRLSSIKYRTSYYDLGVTMDQTKAEEIFGTLTTKANKDIAAAPHAYVSYSGTLHGVSPYRSFTGGTATFKSVSGIDQFDFLTPFAGTSAGTLDTYIERHEADLADYQENYTDLAIAGQGVTQALEEVRAATRAPRRASYGYLQKDSVSYAPIQAEEPFAVIGTGSQAHQFIGTLSGAPLPPYTTLVLFRGTSADYMLGAETLATDPPAIYYHLEDPGTVTGKIILSGPGTGTYDFATSGFFTQPGTLYAEFYGTIGLYNWPDTHEVVRLDAAAGTIPEEKRYMARPEDQLDDDLIFEMADEYPYRRDIVGGGEVIETDFSTGEPGEVWIFDKTMAVHDQTEAEYNVYVVKSALGPRFVIQPRSTTDYHPGQRAIAFRGQFRDQATLTSDDTDLFAQTGGRTSYFHSDLDNVLQPGYALYHAGLVNGVLVADASKFNGEHHRRNLAGWLPFNEHPDDDLAVADVALHTAIQTIAGIAPGNREFDAEQGRCLRIQASGGLMSTAARDCYDDLTLSFWVKCQASSVSADEYVVSFGGIRFSLDFNTKTITGHVLDVDDLTWHDVSNASATDWVFVYLRKTQTEAVFGFGDLLTPSSETNLTGSFASNTGEDMLLVNAAENAGFLIRDLRIWNVSKTVGQMDLTRNYAPLSTVAAYRIGHVLALNDGDRYGLQVLSNGWLAPSNMPAWVRSPKFAKAVKYNGRGEFDAEPWRKEVGLGGGQIPPTTWQLGYQYYGLTAEGTLVVAPTWGALPGVNPLWLDDATGAPGKYTQLAGVPGPTGYTASVQDTGVPSPWPNLMEATNPVVDQIWLTDDDGHVYLCKLEASGHYGARFVAQPGTASNQEQGDALALLAGNNQTLGVTGYGSVVQKPYADSLVTPPLYMYLHDVLLEDVGGVDTLARWTDPTVFGNEHGFPALKSNGELAFTNTATLLAGIYKLRLDLGNIGKVDPEFDGFRLDITLGDLTVNRTLLSGYSGSDFRGQEEIEITLDHDIEGDWLLLLTWLNAYSDTVHGTARQLIVYGYTLRRLETNLFEVSLATSGTTPDLTRHDLHAAGYTATPGGWLFTFNAYGTIVAAAQEGTVYSHNDTLPRSRYPLANLLTGRTADRREDVIVSSGDVLLDDPVDPTLAAFGVGLSVT